jgi:hypothetical protein
MVVILADWVECCIFCHFPRSFLLGWGRGCSIKYFGKISFCRNFTSHFKAIRCYGFQQPQSKILSGHMVLMGCSTSCFPVVWKVACEYTCLLGSGDLWGGVSGETMLAPLSSLEPRGVKESSISSIQCWV